MKIDATWLKTDATWSLSQSIYQAAPFGSVLAAASSNSTLSTGYPTWTQLLSAYTGGIQVSIWSAAGGDWGPRLLRPSIMSNSNGKVYGSVAVTAMGSAFGVVERQGQNDEIEIWQGYDDMQSWTLTGNVNLPRSGEI